MKTIYQFLTVAVLGLAVCGYAELTFAKVTPSLPKKQNKKSAKKMALNTSKKKVARAQNKPVVRKAQANSKFKIAKNEKANPTKRQPASIKEVSNQANLQSVLPTQSLASAAVSRRPNLAGADDTLEVRGQSRTLSMMMVIKNGKENIHFVKVRTDFQPEIQRTQY